MPEPLKNLFSRAYFNGFVNILERFVPGVDKEAFLEAIFDDLWEQKELKERARHTSFVLQKFLYGDFKKDVEVILKMIQYIQEKDSMKPGIESMFFPDYVEVYGIDHFDASLDAMEQITQFFSCEFAIRPFIIKYPQQTLERMKLWSKHPHPMVRRLSTEGCRPRLPWAMAIPFLKKDPSPILPILETLKNDEAETVRKSVANNLNDISKDNPLIAITLAKRWKGKTGKTDWVVKRGCRTLLKQGNPEVLTLFGYGNTEQIAIKDFKTLTPVVELGENLEFCFKLLNNAQEPVLIRLEYGMYYLRSNGSHSKKVFMISEKKYAPGSETNIVRKQSFAPISTRRYYPGFHKVSLILNGKEFETNSFELI